MRDPSLTAPALEPERVRRRVLMVEDDPGDVGSIGRLLRPDPRLRIDHVGTLESVRERLHVEQYDALLLGLVLPDDRRRETLRQAARWAEQIPIVALTAAPDPSLAQACLEAGIEDCVHTSELRADTLVRSLDHAIARHRASEVQRRMEAVERQVALGRIAGGVVHEVNNQATVVLANLEHARLGLEALRPHVTKTGQTLLEEVMESLAADVSALSRIASIVGELRQFSRVRCAATDQIELGALVPRVLRLLEGRLRRSVRVETDLEQVPSVVGNDAKLCQVLVNLLLNAVDAIDESGTSGWIRLRTRRLGRWALLTIEDTGCGIPAESLERIFEPFFSSKTTGRGTGLGLAISSEIVSSFGGSISVQSKIGEGSAFTVRLPLADCTPRARRAPARGAQPAMAPGRILLVDDQAAPRGVVRRMLARHHEVVESSGGAEALELIRTGPAFDLVVCDLMMPGLDGTTVYQCALPLDPELERRFLFLTGGAFTEGAQDFLERAAQPVVTKPVTRAALLAEVEKALMGAGPRREEARAPA